MEAIEEIKKQLAKLEKLTSAIDYIYSDLDENHDRTPEQEAEYKLLKHLKNCLE